MSNGNGKLLNDRILRPSVWVLTLIVICFGIGFWVLRKTYFDWPSYFESGSVNNSRAKSRSWETYQNFKYGFALKYPNYVVEVTNGAQINFWNKETYQATQEGRVINTFPLIAVKYLENIPNEINQSWISTLGFYLLQKKQQYWDGQEIYIAKGSEILSGSSLYIVPLDKGGMLFDMRIETPVTLQILSTFEFIH